jgi:hypothetical protein
MEGRTILTRSNPRKWIILKTPPLEFLDRRENHETIGGGSHHGTIIENSVGDNIDIRILGNVTLDGTGVLSMSNVAQNRIFGDTGSEVLTNGASHTIAGSGQLGVGSVSLINIGTVLANQSTALTIQPNGTGATNNGTFQANSGSLLFMDGTRTNYNSTTSTLTGGIYNAFSGTIELSQAIAATGPVNPTNRIAMPAMWID